ncbi:MAG: hypothetical protein V7607_2529 [Solirubrobacteraceae bacterium]
MLADYFMTIERSEADNAVAALGYADLTGLCWVEPGSGADLLELYRLFGPGGHFYTTSAAEADAVSHSGWQIEGSAGYLHATANGSTVPLFRLSGPGAAHFYTTSESERDAMAAQPLWKFEAGIGYAYPTAHAGSVELWRVKKDERSFPILTDTGDVRVGAGEHVQVSAKLSQNGLLEVWTHIWCTKKLAGFHGGVVAIVADAAGNTLWPTSVDATAKRYGVDGTWTGEPSSRTEKADFQVPGDVLAQVVSVQATAFLWPQNMLLKDLQTIAAAGKSISEIASAIGAIVKLF